MTTNHQMYGDAYTPAEIAERVVNLGVAKAKADWVTLFILGIMAGVFIAFGALLYAVVVTDSTLGFGMTRWVGGISFCLGLILVVVGGAELFTGNNLLSMAWASNLISTKAMLRNWFIVYSGNIIGAILVVAGVYWTNTSGMSNGGVGKTLVSIAEIKSNLTFGQGFIKGILCNVLVCLAVWLSMGGRSVSDKILAVIFPVTAFVVLGFEHSVANWFFLPAGKILDIHQTIQFRGIITNLISVTAGNIVGGSLLVAGIYWLAYLRNKKSVDNSTIQKK
jgi:formate transporter